MRGARASSQHINTQTLIFAIRHCLRNIEQFAPQQAKGLRAKQECTNGNAVAKQ